MASITLKRLRAPLVATVLSAASLLACSTPNATLGNWEYRQANAGMPAGVDAEGERLELRDVDGRVVGTWLGLERMGEHGLYYTAVNLEDVVIEAGQVSFTVPARALFAERPATIAAAATMQSSGSTKTSLTLTGRLVDDRLVLHCSSTDFSYPDGTLIFERGEW